MNGGPLSSSISSKGPILKVAFGLSVVFIGVLTCLRGFCVTGSATQTSESTWLLILFPYQDSPFIVSQGLGCFSKLPKSLELGSKSTTSTI